MKLLKLLRWYFKLRKLRLNSNHPINSKHIWRVAKFMSK